MSELTGSGNQVDRREFLRGSLLAAAGGLLAASSASAQEPQARPAPPTEEGKPSEEPKKDEPATKKLVDSQGREFRVCDMCGGNMYRQDNTWTCEQCGYSYEE